MSTSQHAVTVAIIFLAMAPLRAQTTPEEAMYLNQAARLAPMVDVEQDEVIRFESDVTGDGKAEVFFTKASLRDGKHGYVWNIYERTSAGALRSIGDATFSDAVFTPSTWKANAKAQGFYTYSPSGAGRGSLAFFEVNASGITRRESRKIEPNGADKAEFDGLFGARLKGETPKVELKRTSLPKTPSASPLHGDEASTQQPPVKQTPTITLPSNVKPALTPKAPEAKPPPPSDESTSSTPWSVVVALIVAAIGLLWLVLKKRK